MKRLIVLFLGFLSYISLNAQDYVTVSSLLFENQYYTITLTNNRINNYDLYVEYFFTYNGERIGTIHRANIPSGKKSCTEMLVGYTEKQNAWMSKIPRGEENNVGITILFVGKREGKLYTSTGSGNGIRHTTNNSQSYSQITTQNKGSNQAYNNSKSTYQSQSTNNIEPTPTNKRIEFYATDNGEGVSIRFYMNGSVKYDNTYKNIHQYGTYMIDTENNLHFVWNNGKTDTGLLRYESSGRAVVHYKYKMFQRYNVSASTGTS